MFVITVPRIFFFCCDNLFTCNKNGLFIDSLIPIERSDYPVFNLGSDTVVCKANGLFVKVVGTSDSVKWRDGSSSVSRLLNESKRYFATAYNNNSASFAFEKEGYKELDITLYKNYPSLDLN